MAHEPSVLIIGAGVFGASTAYHLALQYENPGNITVVDRTPVPPSPAASTDINKIVRADYSVPFYCDLAYEAMEAWASWRELKDFYHRTGWVMLDTEGSDLADRIRKVFKDRGHDPTKDIALTELNKHWKGILKGTDLQDFTTAYFNPEAGWCDAAAATASIMNAAIARGVQYVTSCVESIIIDGPESVAVLLGDGRRLGADKLVFASGAWTSKLFSPVEDLLQIPSADRIERQLSAAGVAVVHYKMSDSEMEQLSEMPVVVYGDHGEVIPPPAANRLLKYTNAHTFTNTITLPSGQRISVPPDRDQHMVPEALKSETEVLMSTKVMPTFPQRKQADYWRLCWDARTPTQDWLLCAHPHPQLRNVYLATGGSFHSYKFLPIIGKYMVNVLSGKGNGSEKDEAWAWKSGTSNRRGAHEKTEPNRELRDLGS